MAKDFDIQLDLDNKKASKTFDLGISLESQPTITSALDKQFPHRQQVRSFTPSTQPLPGTAQAASQFRTQTQDRPQTISQGEPARVSPIRRLVRAIPGDSRFEKSLERDVIEPIAKVGRFIFPSEQDYYREATEELGSNATTEQVISRGKQLMQADGFLSLSEEQEIGGMIVSPTDMAPVSGRIGAATKLKAGFNRTIRLLSKRLTSETNEAAIEQIVRDALTGAGDEDIKAASRLIARTDNQGQIADVLGEVARKAEENIFNSAPRRFTPENIPTPAKNEQIVFFKKTGGDTQYVFNNLDEAVRYFDGKIDDLEIGTVPRNVIKQAPDTEDGLRSGVQLIPRSVADDVVRSNRILQDIISDNADEARFIRDEVMPGRPASPERVLGREPSPMQTIRKRESTLLREKLQQAQSISRRAAVATRGDVKSIQNDLVSLVGDLPLQERGKFIATIKNIQTPSQLKRAMPDVQRRVDTALQKVAEQEQTKALRKQVRDVISQKQLQNTEALRKALKLPSLNKMTVDDLRTFARTLAPYKPQDRFLSQRIIETIDRTSLKDLRTYREVQAALAKEAGVPIEDLQKIKTSWYNKFQYDTALARENPFYDVVVRKINGSLVEGNIRFAQFEDELDNLLNAARKSKPRGITQRAVPTDDAIFKYIESPNKEELVDTLTPEELQAANFLIDRYAEAKEYLLRENVMNKYVQDYVTHIRRSGLEAYKQDGLVSAIKETFSQYRIDQANFNIINEKTGNVLPLEKFFAFAQQRTGGLTPTQNIARASKAYFMAFERKRALDAIVPELQAYVQSVTPTRKTPKGLDFDPSLKNFLKTYINNKRGRPATLIFNPGTAPDVVLRGITAATRLRDLGLSLPNFAAANVGEQVSTFIQQGTKQYATGIRRMNTRQGKAIIEKYRGFVGRSPWKEISDTSKNFPDKMMTMMLSGFHDASVRANKQGLLGALTPEEFKTGVISPERLQQIRVNEMGRWRALDNSASIIGSTAEGKVFTQYKAWAVPIISSTIDNLSTIIKTTGRGENPLVTRAGQETLREAMVVGTVALVIYAYVNEEDDSFIGQMISKSTRDALSAVGALDPEMWVQTPRAWQYIQDLQEALRTLVMLEEYKTGEREGTLKGDNMLARLVTPAPVRQIAGAAESASQQTSQSNDIDFDLELDLDTGVDVGDFDIGLDI